MMISPLPSFGTRFRLLQKNDFEVLLSVAEFTRHHNQMLVNFKEIEDRLTSARYSAQYGRAKDAVESLLSAYQSAARTVEDRQRTVHYFKEVWAKSRKPGYLTRGDYFQREERIDLEGWMQSLADVIRNYARANDILLQELEPILR